MFGDLTPFIVSGLTVGAIYGLAGTGFVITYKTSGIFNFAHPVMAAMSAYLFWYLHYDDITPGPKLGWQISAIIAVLVLGPLMGLGMEIIARGLSRVATSLQVLATIGMLLSITGALSLFHQNSGTLPFQQYLSTKTFEVSGAFVGYDQLILFLFSLAVVVILYIYFRVARTGVAMRAVVDNPELLDVMGTNPNAVRRSAWIIGATFAAASGVLLGPIVAQLSAGSLVNIIISAFGAAAIGAFSNLPMTFVGGLLIGVVGDVSQKYTSDINWLNGSRGALPFIVLFAVLVVTNPNKLRERRVAAPKPVAQNYYAPGRVRIGAAIIIFGFLALIPSLVTTELSVWLFGLTYMILFLSIGLLVKVSGQVSLAHTALAAVGGATLARGISSFGMPWGIALIFAGVVTAIVGLAIAIPAIRVSGVFLALATFGFGLFLQQMVYPTNLMFGSSTSGVAAPRPSFANTDTKYYYLVLAFLALVGVVMTIVQYGRLGRLARALGDSPLALNTTGTTVTVTLISVFAVSAFLAGVAGALYASASQAVYLGAPMYAPFISLQFFALVMLLQGGSPWYGIAGGFTLQIAPYYFGKWLHLDNVAPYLSLLFGVGAVGVALTRTPGMPPGLQRFWERFRKPIDTSKSDAIVLEHNPPTGSGLEIREMSVRYGGFLAVDTMNLKAPPGRITALIGPNGAGKTTTFNACSGLVKPSTGKVYYDDDDITRLSPAARARKGLGRTFQKVELWPSLTVEQNIALGSEAPLAGGDFRKQIIAGRGEPARTAAAVKEAMDLTDIGHIKDRLIADLSTGEKRLVELARVLAGPFETLLLDEPSSGLDTAETERFGQVLRNVVDTRGTGALLVEHDMLFVTQVCDYIYVLDFGHLIFEGTAQETMESDIVRTAYLGTEAVPVAASEEV
jgi:ABC-type branched-subunit amino acid transport system ATPase component/branched-subunit amino acid ABC-type transport system permease component